MQNMNDQLYTAIKQSNIQLVFSFLRGNNFDEKALRESLQLAWESKCKNNTLEIIKWLLAIIMKNNHLRIINDFFEIEDDQNMEKRLSAIGNLIDQLEGQMPSEPSPTNVSGNVEIKKLFIEVWDEEKKYPESIDNILMPLLQHAIKQGDVNFVNDALFLINTQFKREHIVNCIEWNHPHQINNPPSE